MSGDAVRNFSDAILSEGIKTTARRLEFYYRFLFSGVNLERARVLDIGGGAGMASLWAASMGAREVICLEPEVAGSTRAVSEKFERMRQRIPAGDRVRLVPARLQDYADDGQFDVILMHNSVNHLDEEACIHLRDGEQYRARYRAIFEQLARWSPPGARLIASDCSSRNFFGDLGLRHPLARSIDWKKHQPPRVWAALLRETGFAEPRISWSSFNALGRPGRVLTGNALAAYFLISHFRLQMTRR
jgi:SAM-dependent methyltransferase